jgi:hypothetical protein
MPTLGRGEGHCLRSRPLTWGMVGVLEAIHFDGLSACRTFAISDTETASAPAGVAALMLRAKTVAIHRSATC